ncbi:MAG: hypothetical protein P4L67_03845 [Candidatus Pacebacteria bacterium]|nr:hypothetical protein [Candidatus Paceibacterota bacterium]
MEKNKDFLSGKKTKEQILGEFLNNFEGAMGNKDGIVTKDEFFDYYTDLSTSITNDDLFVAMVESAWNLAEDESAPEFQKRLGQLEATVRLKLQSMSKGKDETYLRKLFNDFDKSKSDTITLDEFDAMVHKLGVATERKYLTALFSKMDTKKIGVAAFIDFAGFVAGSPKKM